MDHREKTAGMYRTHRYASREITSRVRGEPLDDCDGVSVLLDAERHVILRYDPRTRVLTLRCREGRLMVLPLVSNEVGIEVRLPGEPEPWDRNGP